MAPSAALDPAERAEPLMAVELRGVSPQAALDVAAMEREVSSSVGFAAGAEAGGVSPTMFDELQRAVAARLETGEREERRLCLQQAHKGTLARGVAYDLCGAPGSDPTAVPLRQICAQLLRDARRTAPRAGERHARTA